MARLRYNGLTTTLGSGLTAAATTVTFTAPLTHAGGSVPTIITGDVLPLALATEAGVLAEVVYLTAYTQGATTGTIQRAREGTTAASHATGAKVIHGPLAADLANLSSVTWDRLVDADPMATNTGSPARWTADSGTWVFGGTYGVQQTAGSTTDAWLRRTDGSAGAYRCIKATIRSVSGQVVGFGFGSNQSWFTGSLGIGLKFDTNQIWYDRYGSGGSTIASPVTLARDTDYTLMVVERNASATYWVYLNGTMAWEIQRPSDVNLGGIGLYCRSAVGWYRNVSIWSGSVPFDLPSGAI